MVSDTDNNSPGDTDVLRAEDIVPPYNKEQHRGQDLPTTQAGRKQSPSSLSASCPQQTDRGATEPAEVVLDTSEIPKFDLAEQIMAEQRKITAIRRKAPHKKTKTPDPQPRIHSTGYALKSPPQVFSEKELIIAEIVTRDIEKMYRGDSSSLRNW